MPPSVFDQTQYDNLSTGTQIEPVTQDFDESKGVAGRVNTITSSGSPLLETARTRAAQAANQRGLRNSSMAVQSGEQAVIETATPIAQADASLFQNQALANQSARNTTNQFNSNMRANVGLAGLQAGQQEGQFGRSLMEQARQFDTNTGLQREDLAETRRQFDTSTAQQGDQFTRQQQQQRELQTQQLDMQRTIAQMDADSRMQLAEVEAGFRRDIASNENIAQAWGTMMQNINQIQNNPDLEAGARSTAIQNQIESFRSFTGFWQKVSGGDIDVGDLLNFGIVAPERGAADDSEEPPPNINPAEPPGGY